ncbi:hypothetical protein [Methanobrevibacter arboriphilus]|uniref:hypothetical protein n=1 Tax=Methanobrevibacter arboriphilus TaxID=39441 RepID=UPI000B1308F6|nr:hypothetical protein [Methanobrevibacter arboriphilus]
MQAPILKKESEIYGVNEIPCASCPSTDNEFKFAKKGNVYHEGIENSRQDKIRTIINFFG